MKTFLLFLVTMIASTQVFACEEQKVVELTKERLQFLAKDRNAKSTLSVSRRPLKGEATLTFFSMVDDKGDTYTGMVQVGVSCAVYSFEGQATDTVSLEDK